MQSPDAEWIPGSERERDDPIEIVDYDPTWPERFERWRTRLADALGVTALRIEHVGSTAVLGLAAKPILDVQVSVRDVDDEAAYVARIEALGLTFRLREPERRFFETSLGRPRTEHVHVCGSGSAWERRHLLFRDFLRADAATRDAYADLKRNLAARYRDDRMGYTDAKSAFLLDVMERAERWALERR